MINFDDHVKGIAFNENKTKHNKNWSYIPNHPYRILIIEGSGSGKTNLLLNLNRKSTRHMNQNKIDMNQKIHMNQNINI